MQSVFAAENVQAAHGKVEVDQAYDERSLFQPDWISLKFFSSPFFLNLWRGCGRTASPPWRKTSGPPGSSCTAAKKTLRKPITSANFQNMVISTGWPISLVTKSRWLSSDSSDSWWAATVATYCPGRMAKHPKSKSTGGCYHAEWSPCTQRTEAAG